MSLRRSLGALVRRGREPAAAATRYDEWLELAAGEELRAIEAACADGGTEQFARFRGLDADVWALLLTQEYDAYPNIRALLPAVPDPALQELWNGASGVRLASQGAAFYAKLLARYERVSTCPLVQARVLDFGCGWGRLTRFLARDVASGNLYGCDPVESILDVCRRTRVPATLARSDFAPAQLPFDATFDLAFAFSVFTHLSEAAHLRCLEALHTAMRPGAVLVVTVRPAAYLELMQLVPDARLEGAAYVFVPHPAEASHPQYAGGEMTYGETVVTLPYVRERWSPLFELLGADVLLGDPYQVMLTLRRA
jgi:SAM-dependent methyltransferase